MSDIHNYADLLEEKKKLEATLVVEKAIIFKDLAALKEEFRPYIDVASMVLKSTGQKRNSLLLLMAVNLAGIFFLRKVVLSRSSKITQMVVPMLVKGVSAFFSRKKEGRNDAVTGGVKQGVISAS